MNNKYNLKPLLRYGIFHWNKSLGYISATYLWDKHKPYFRQSISPHETFESYGFKESEIER